MTMTIRACLLAILTATATPAAEVATGGGGGARQLLVVAPSYWAAREAGEYGFDVFDLDADGRRIHHAEPADIGEIRGLAFSPATQRLIVSGHEGMACHVWPGFERVWRQTIDPGKKPDFNDAISITRDGTRIYSIRHFASGMNVYDAGTGERLRVVLQQEIRKWGRFSQVSHDGQRLYSSRGAVFDLADETPCLRIKMLEAHRFALTPDGNFVVYATGRERSLAIHDAASGALVHEVAAPRIEAPVRPPEKQKKQKDDPFGDAFLDSTDDAPAVGASLAPGIEKRRPKAPKKKPPKGNIAWVALSPDGKHAWAHETPTGLLYHFDLAASPPVCQGAVQGDAKDNGLMFSVDGRLLVTRTGTIRDARDGRVLGRLQDENGHPRGASNNMIALQVDQATGQVVLTNQQCAPAWPGGTDKGGQP